MSPFWEGLAVVLVGGLLSSTFLVITVFPYYYLGSEFLRTRISRTKAITWILLSFLLVIILMRFIRASALLVGPIVAALLVKYTGSVKRATRKS